jgi:uncharacterized membrane protein YidH (DUF202 family)
LTHLWTIIFVAVLAVAFALAHWHDREEARRRERRNAAAEEKDSTED